VLQHSNIKQDTPNENSCYKKLGLNTCLYSPIRIPKEQIFIQYGGLRTRQGMCANKNVHAPLHQSLHVCEISRTMYVSYDFGRTFSGDQFTVKLK